ncbi:hypothetical protein GP486_008152 [Trichoglossum hirsutum]|uniref:Uncharacterized protein n=1 Tax=Trichoglossum hirsutum TaxID=265104 RepID=A0A9P8IBI0_9PEZI|nr:hypothetical protein GP486_008152 [Trichoglossum hirsutum]
MVSTFIRIFASLALASLATAGGQKGLLRSCYGFVNGKAYNVDIAYVNIPGESIGSICGSFNNQFHSDCDKSNVNCRTSGSTVTLGVLTHKGSSDSFSCTQEAFRKALQADSILVEQNEQCSNTPLLPATASQKKRSSFRARAPRGSIGTGIIPQNGDFLSLESGQLLELVGLADDGDDINIPLTDIIPSLPAIGTNLALGGAAINSVTTPLTGGGSLFATFDAGINHGPGVVTANDWSTIVGSMATFVSQASRRRKARMIFRNAAGLAVMGVVIVLL